MEKISMVLQTSRLVLSEFDTTDSPFILLLLNTPGWLRFIGDRGVRNITDAENYLQQGPMKSYTNHGFGLWKVTLKEGGLSVGMCGILKRDILENPDVGFAFLPQFTGFGYARECVEATVRIAKDKFDLARLDAITTPDNTQSQKVLAHAGFAFENNITNDNGEELFRFSRSL